VTGSAGFGAAGVLSGDVQLSGDSAIEFASGQISTLWRGSHLTLDGKRAFIEDSKALGSNSALAGLANVSGGTLYLENGASVSTTGALVNDGTVYLDFDGGYGGGGSSLMVAGALTNNGLLDIYASSLSASDEVTAASLTNAGTIYLTGSSTQQALLDVTRGVAGFGSDGVLSGDVELYADSAIEFASGQISTIAGYRLVLEGNSAFIEESKALGSNSALTGLADIASQLLLFSGASVSTTGSVTNSGLIGLDNGVYIYVEGGSTLSVGGTLTNTGELDIGNSHDFESSASATAKSFVNSGTVGLTGAGTNFAALSVAGATTNNGTIWITTDTEELAGAVGGKGHFSLSTANLLFDSSVSAGQTIDESGGINKLTLEQAQKFGGTISGFGTGDTIDAANFLLSGTTFNFANGMLTLHDGSLTADIHMTGAYSNSNFTLAPDHGTGTLVKFV
jgi:hypothetical protein